MKGIVNYNYFIVGVLFLITLETPFIVAFSTPKCDHSEIEKHLKTTLNCIMKSQNKNMKAFLDLSHNEIASLKDGATNDTTAEWCELVDEEIACFTDNLGTCFNKQITDEFSVLMEWYYNKQPYMSCNRIEGLSKEEIEKKAKDIVRNYKEDVSSLKEILTFDQQCSTDELVMSVKSKWPCFMMHFYAVIQEIMPHVIGPNPSEPKSFPICKNFVGLLNDCFGETSCLSQPEMNLMRDFLATYYNVAMGFVVQLTSKFGSMSKFMETMGVGTSDVHDLEGYPKLNKQMKKMMMKGMDLIVDDFKTDECQKSLKQFPMMVDEKLIQSLPLDGGTQPFIIIIALVLSLVVIMLVAMLGWVLYAYRNPTTRSGQILIRSTAKSRLFRSPSTSTV